MLPDFNNWIFLLLPEVELFYYFFLIQGLIPVAFGTKTYQPAQLVEASNFCTYRFLFIISFVHLLNRPSSPFPFFLQSQGCMEHYSLAERPLMSDVRVNDDTVGFTPFATGILQLIHFNNVSIVTGSVVMFFYQTIFVNFKNQQ